MLLIKVKIKEGKNKMTRKLEKLLIGFGAVGVGTVMVLSYLPNAKENPEYIVGSILAGAISTLVGSWIYSGNEQKAIEEVYRRYQQAALEATKQRERT